MTETQLRYAATVILVRNGKTGVEVLLQERSGKSESFGGMFVFPGGKVDLHDADRQYERLYCGHSDKDASNILGVPRYGLAYWMGGIRECFEEAGILLARETVFETPDRSFELVKDIQQGNPNFDLAERLRALVELFRFDETGDTGVVLKLKAASEAFQNKDEEAGIDLLVQAVMLDKTYANDLPRRACIAIFDFWGRQHPLSQKFSRRFEMALY